MSTSGLSFPSIDAAITGFEGGMAPGSLQAINNNPGNLQYAPWESGYGGTPGTGGFAAFPDVASGQYAQDALVSSYANQPGETLSQLLESWAPSSTGNPTKNYVDYVAGKTGLDPNAPITSQTNLPSGSNLSLFNLGPLNTLLNAPTMGDNPVSKTLNAINPANWFKGFTWGRVAAFVLGFILIAAGLMMFKPVENVVTSAVEAA